MPKPGHNSHKKAASTWLTQPIYTTFQQALSHLVNIFHKKNILEHQGKKIQESFQKALLLHEQGRIGQAEAMYQEILKIQPDHFDSLHLLGVAAIQSGKLALGVELISEAITRNPNIAVAHYNRGNALRDLKRLDEALASYDGALALEPDFVDAHYNRGNTLQALNRLEDAVASFARVLALRPDFADAYNNQGNALKALNRSAEALASYDMVLALKPDIANAYVNRGNALLDLKRFDEALASYDKALVLSPDYPDAHNNRGVALQELKRLDEALASFGKVLMLKPDFADAYASQGNILFSLNRLEEALVSYNRAFLLKPAYEFSFLMGTFLHTKMKLCDWDSLSQAISRYANEIAGAKRVTHPFPAVCLLDRPDLQLTASSIYAQAQYPMRSVLGAMNRRAADGKIRVGYYSADFYSHATTHLMAELFEAHNTDKFSFYGFSFGPDVQDTMRQRVSSAFEMFFDVGHMNDCEVAKLSRECDIDIAVDLKGYTQDARAGIFSYGCAPIQVNYLGYPGTMGAEYIDYIIADKTVLPEQNQAHFTEKVVYLPHSYQVNDSHRKISERVFTKRELGLPETGFVFCCFNNSYKIQPAMFDGWMRILTAAPGSVLWLLEDNSTAVRNLRREAQARGVDGTRLVFAKRMNVDEHLARHRLANLFIDTLPCNAHTTASDALWTGIPVLTCMGQSFASRVAASLLNAMGLPELITHTPAQYESRAIALARNPEELHELKNRVERNRLTSSLFNGKLFARHMECAYEAMYARYQAGLSPDHIYVAEQPVGRGNTRI